jgi:hypothetical protein
MCGKRKVPLFAGLCFRLVQLRTDLATALPWLVGVLALTARILLLLSGLLAAALLLARFLASVLVLLARLLVLVGHRISVVGTSTRDNPDDPETVSMELEFRRDNRVAMP